MGSSHLPPESAYFLSANRNKRSITVDFKSSAGLEILHRLIQQSDIFVENFISGKLDAIGLGWDHCHRINPRLIYASITGNCVSQPLSQSPRSLQYRRVWSDRTVQRGRRIRCGYRGRRYTYAPIFTVVTDLMSSAGLMHM